jgi:hypothetical protein
MENDIKKIFLNPLNKILTNIEWKGLKYFIIHKFVSIYFFH